MRTKSIKSTVNFTHVDNGAHGAPYEINMILYMISIKKDFVDKF